MAVTKFACTFVYRLRLEREFDKRVTEVDSRGAAEDEDDDFTPSVSRRCRHETLCLVIECKHCVV